MPVLGPRQTLAVEVGVLSALGAFLIYQHFLPPVTQVKNGYPAHNSDIESAEREALLVTTGFVAVVSLFVKSWDTFLIGAAGIVVTDFAFKHANAVSPDTGKMQAIPNAPPGTLENTAGMYSLPDYTDMASQAS